MSTRRLALALAAMLPIYGCTAGSEPTVPSQGGTATPFPAPPGSTQPVPLQWLVDDLAGVASDGAGAYADGECGVGAYLNDTGGFLAPAGNRSKCGYGRSVSVNLGTTTVDAIRQMGVLGLGGILAGTTGTAPVNVQTGLASCAILRYNAETGAEATVTGTTTGTGARQWVVESVSPHLAGCYVSQKNGFVWDRVQRAVPFRVTITTR